MEWISVKDRLPEDKEYTKCLIAVWYRLAVDFPVTLEHGLYDGWSKSFEWKCGQYSDNKDYIVLGWVPENSIVLPEPPTEEE